MFWLEGVCDIKTDSSIHDMEDLHVLSSFQDLNCQAFIRKALLVLM